MKTLCDYKGEESIIVNGRIMKPMSVILRDEELMKEFEKDQFGAMGEIMQKHSKEVFEVVDVVSGGNCTGSVGVYFMSIFIQYCKELEENSFFKSQATTK